MKTNALICLVVPVVAALLLANCASPPARSAAAWEPNRKTRPAVTEFWTVFPPKSKDVYLMHNYTLPKDTPVLLINARRSYARVQLESLDVGWVRLSNLKL